MVNLAEKHDDADSVQLADAEISQPIVTYAAPLYW